ncbi:hypothetical protein AArcSl_1612 [Halalkaliarchaeum desulfuricum]|uniref:Uncharacterized protein n=1 Tax=Halalkaliarchaeum desulfuricum TaxID=2055893 RepID=A0A343TJG9_9EURY|nr:hypothetical protein [Halalkaliarchaeum desulfuricum]AUX09241.1 hypothetical protein AArcSl_1612 [Halalkaliarchaeum desulfuricum]
MATTRREGLKPSHDIEAPPDEYLFDTNTSRWHASAGTRAGRTATACGRRLRTREIAARSPTRPTDAGDHLCRQCRLALGEPVGATHQEVQRAVEIAEEGSI